MKSSDWLDIDKHFSMGVIFDIKKDSWPISFVLDITDTGGKHKQDGLEDLGHTTEYHEAEKLDVNTLSLSDNGRHIYPGDVQRAMRVLAGIEQHPSSLQFPLDTGDYMDFF